MFVSKISLEQRSWILRSLIELLFVVFPNTDRQYSNIYLIKAFYNNFLGGRGMYFNLVII